MLPLPLLLAFAAQPGTEALPLAPLAWDAPTQGGNGSRSANETARVSTPSGFQYSFVEVELGLVDLDGVSDDLYTFGINGSYNIEERFFVFGEYQAGYADIDGVGDLNTDVFVLGVGFHTPLSDPLDFFAKFGLVHAEAELDGADEDDNGWDLEGGVRYWATDKIELDGSLEYVDVDDSDTGLNLAGRYYFTPPVSAGVQLSFFDDQSALFFNLRYAF